MLHTLRLIHTDQPVQMVVVVSARLHLVCAGKDIEKQCSGIYPLQSVYVRKVKILRAPRFDVSKLMEVHGDYTEEVCAVASCMIYVCMQRYNCIVDRASAPCEGSCFLCMELCLAIWLWPDIRYVVMKHYSLT